jgi:hypothetical protein
MDVDGAFFEDGHDLCQNARSIFNQVGNGVFQGDFLLERIWKFIVIEEKRRVFVEKHRLSSTQAPLRMLKGGQTVVKHYQISKEWSVFSGF